MKKGFFRRGMVLLLAAVMVMGMSVSAFAADGGNAKRLPGRAAVFYGWDQASIWRPRNPAMVCTSL